MDSCQQEANLFIMAHHLDVRIFLCGTYYLNTVTILIIRLAKSFRYITEPLQIEPKHLFDTPLLSSRSFHLLTSPSDTIDQTRELSKLRLSCGIIESPIIIWEPAPASCVPENLAMCFETINFVDVFSPNHIELAALFDTDLSRHEKFDRATTEMQARKFLEHRTNSSKPCTVVIRAGPEGCCIYNRKKKDFVWLPSFYADSPKIVDPTGAGNAFLGGFAIGLLETGDDLLAACYGMVASTFALEQISLPLHEPSPTLAIDGTIRGSEVWNGSSVRGRLREYTSRVAVVLDEYLIHATAPKGPILSPQ